MSLLPNNIPPPPTKLYGSLTLPANTPVPPSDPGASPTLPANTPVPPSDPGSSPALPANTLVPPSEATIPLPAFLGETDKQALFALTNKGDFVISMSYNPETIGTSPTGENTIDGYPWVENQWITAGWVRYKSVASSTTLQQAVFTKAN